MKNDAESPSRVIEREEEMREKRDDGGNTPSETEIAPHKPRKGYGSKEKGAEEESKRGP